MGECFAAGTGGLGRGWVRVEFVATVAADFAAVDIEWILAAEVAGGGGLSWWSCGSGSYTERGSRTGLLRGIGGVQWVEEVLRCLEIADCELLDDGTFRSKISVRQMELVSNNQEDPPSSYRPHSPFCLRFDESISLQASNSMI